MLEHVIFLIMHRKDNLEQLCQDLIKRNVEITYEKPTGKNENSLIVVDDELLGKRLLQESHYVVGYSHKNNPNHDFFNFKYVIQQLNELDYEEMDKIYKRYAKQPWDIRKTKRCLLRELTVDDVDSLYELYADPAITEYMPSLFENPKEEKEYTQNYIQYVYELYGYGIWGIFRRETNILIGRAGLEEKEGEEGLELGYMLGTSYQKKGYAYEVCKAILDYAQVQLGVHRVFSYVAEDNLPSVRLLRKLGFQKVKSKELHQEAYVCYEISLMQ